MKHRRLKVKYANRVRDYVVAVIVGLADRNALLHAAAGDPHREIARVMIATVIGLGELALAIDRAPEFPAPDDQRVVEQAALFQVLNERRGRLIRAPALERQVARQVAVLIPASVIKLNEADAAFGQTSREQTVGGVGAGLARFRAVHLEDAVRLFRQV